MKITIRHNYTQLYMIQTVSNLLIANKSIFNTKSNDFWNFMRNVKKTLNLTDDGDLNNNMLGYYVNSSDTIRVAYGFVGNKLNLTLLLNLYISTNIKKEILIICPNCDKNRVLGVYLILLNDLVVELVEELFGTYNTYIAVTDYMDYLGRMKKCTKKGGIAQFKSGTSYVKFDISAMKNMTYVEF